MIDIVVVFPKAQDGAGIRNLLMRNGYNVAAVCTSGAQAMSVIDNMDYGIIVCGYQFNDMMYEEIYDELPPTFQMLLLASRVKLNNGVVQGVISLEMPIKSYDMMNTLEMMSNALHRLKKKGRDKPKERNVAQKELIDQAKKILMDKKKMTEEEAHRYIQKNSMDSGTSMVETAQMILQIIH